MDLLSFQCLIPIAPKNELVGSEVLLNTQVTKPFFSF